MTKPLERHTSFSIYLCSLADRESRSALAALRRGLSDERGGTAETFRYVVPWLPSTAGQTTEDAYYLVAGLFALHPRNWPTNEEYPRRTNFGASYARLKSEESRSVERRFVALLNADDEDMHVHLRHAVGLLRAGEIPVDWAQLLADIERWGHEDHYVQRDWARSFWAPPRREEAAHDASEAAAAEVS